MWYLIARNGVIGQISATAEERELLDSAVDVIRARTLSILRRFENDPERKTSVILFLIEADIVSKLKLNLSSAYLRGADLRGADLRGADLSSAKLSSANLSSADLSGAKLICAALSRANLSGATLSSAKLSGAKLSGADLSGADLSGAKLHNADLYGSDLTTDQLKDAKLCRTKLPPGITLNPNRDCKALGLPEE